MAEDNENDVSGDGGESKGKKIKGIPTVVIIAVVAVLMMAAGVFVGKMMFGGGGVVVEEGDKTEVVKEDAEKKDTENLEKKDGEEVKEEDKKNTEENAGEGTDNSENTAEEKTDGEQKDGEGKDPKELKKGKGNLKLEEFLINLNDPLVRRYVKFIINLRLTKAIFVDQIKEDENLIPEMRDKIFELVSDKSYTDLKSSAGKVMLKEEIMISINEILKDSIKVEPVIKVMFSKFILQ